MLTIWVNPCQARVHSMEEAVKELTTWVSSGPDWPYALVQLNVDTHHVPLPKEGHLGILPQGGADMTACRRISQLEVCQHLVSDLQVTYQLGLNGCKDPIITIHGACFWEVGSLLTLTLYITLGCLSFGSLYVSLSPSLTI